MTLPTMKAGDDVQLTLRGKVRVALPSAIRLKLDGAQDTVWISFETLTAPTARVEVLPPPIDPDLVLAREVVIDLYGAIAGSDKDWPDRVAAGIHDNSDHVRTALAAIKASKAGGRV